MTNPTKPPTPAEYAVIAILFSAILIGLGIVGLVIAFRFPPEKHDAAMALEHYAGWSLAIGIMVAVFIWLIRKITN
jgi:uncharacterized YccA/Bax inhibitor family protein